MADKKPLLDITTDRFVAHITIDDKPYGLLRSDHLSILQQRDLTNYGNQLSKAQDLKTEKDEQRYSCIMTSILLLIMPVADKKLIEKLSISTKLAILGAYNEVTTIKKKKVKKKPQSQ